MNIHTWRYEMLKRLKPKNSAHSARIETVDSEITPSTLQEDYESLIADNFAMMDIGSDQVRISVRSVGRSPAGLEVYAAFIKVLRWDRQVIHMLSRMPLIEKRIDRRVKQSPLAQYSGFAGIWFRTPAELDEPVATVH